MEKQINPFNLNVCGLPIIVLFVLGIFYLFLLLLLEYSNDGGSGGSIGQLLRWFQDSVDRLALKCLGIENTNSISPSNNLDVETERQKVLANKERLKDTSPVLLVNLWKMYPKKHGVASYLCKTLFRFLKKRKSHNDKVTSNKATNNVKVAVAGISTAIQSGETFGLLGVNGAGKSTTLNILTSYLRPTFGEVYIAGHDVTGYSPHGVSRARKCIGYCPQTNPLPEFMTGRETLFMFGKLRGISNNVLHSVVDRLIKFIGLTTNADMMCTSYSEGNKRKLSLALAVVGNPQVLFIDEASSGMDPVARRAVLELISLISTKRSVIITTHSMEEAEALCSRVAIMIDGQIQCIGSPLHLKDIFLGGYNVDLQCKLCAPHNVIDRLQKKILKEFPASILAERHGNFLRFSLPHLKCNEISKVFQKLRSMKFESTLMIDNYSVSQCSLEQIFINLTKKNSNKL